jgi:hypothetical protein
MRPLFRPVVMFAVLATFTAVVQSQDSGQQGAGGNPGVNLIYFNQGSPSAIKGGVSVSLTIQPTATWTCNSVTISIVNQNAQTLATTTIDNPGGTVNQTFSNLGSGVSVEVVVNAIFQSGAQFEFPLIDADVTTQ